MIPSKILEVLAHLEFAGHKAYMVGGAVRDMLMGIKPKDYDICTSAMPDEVVKLFTSTAAFRADFKVSDIDAKSFHVVKVNDIEIATFRKDIYENGETIGTESVSTLFEDLSRRDLTINAMAMDARGNLIDPYHGKADLENKIIRFVGLAIDRILEDPNRIIRACRFAATIQGKFELQTQHALCQTVSFIDKMIAPERIQEEIIKAMKIEKPSLFFHALIQIGALKKIFPDLYKTYGLDGGKYHDETVFKHSMIVGDEIETKNPMLRLTAYLHDVGKSRPNYIDDEIHFYDHHTIGAEMVEENLKRLRFSNRLIKYATNLIAVHMRGALKAKPKGIRKILKKFAELDVDWEDWVALKVADRKGNLKRTPLSKDKIDRLRRKFKHELEPNSARNHDGKPSINRAFTVKELAISGTRIQELLNIGPSEVVGAILQFLLKKVIDNPELNTPENLERTILGKKGKVK